MCLSEGKEEKRRRRGAQQKKNHTRETTTQEQKPNQPDKGQKPNQTQTKQTRGEAGKAKEDRGGEGRAYRIRVAIVQLSGDQWGTRIIIMMNTSVW